jgi:hypothetical protein
MDNAAIFYGHLVPIFYVNLVMLRQFGIIPLVFVTCAKKNLAKLVSAVDMKHNGHRIYHTRRYMASNPARALHF